MTRLDLIKWCDAHDACAPALEWLSSLSCESAQECYELCPRGDWLLWGAHRRGLPLRRQIAVAAACARHVLPVDARPASVRAVELAERYGAGEDVPLAEMRQAVTAARAAEWAAQAAASAAWAAARAARAAEWAMDAAADAEIAVAMATANAAEAVWEAVRAAATGEIADLVRKMIPWQEVAL